MSAVVLFLATYFALGSMGFWLLFLVSAALGLLCAAKDAPVSFTMVVLATIAAVFVANGLNPLHFGLMTWLSIGAAAILYLPAGVVFARARWGSYVTSRR